MFSKDIVCKEFGNEEVIPYHLELLSKVDVDIFLPITFNMMSDKSMAICYDISEGNPLGIRSYGNDAPYISSSLIRGMRTAMDNYFFPNQYHVKNRCVYTFKNGDIKLAYIPIKTKACILKDPGNEIRRKVSLLLQESFDGDGKDNPIYAETLRILSNGEIGLDACIRMLDKVKEDTYYSNTKGGPGNLDLYGNFV